MDELRLQLAAAHAKIHELIHAEEPELAKTDVTETDVLERAAAAVMHDALTNALPGVTAPTPTATAAQSDFQARVGGASGALCYLTLTPSQLVWHPQQCGAEFHAIPLNQIDTGEIDDDDDVRAVLWIGLTSGSRFALDFGSTGAAMLAADKFEEALRSAVANAEPLPGAQQPSQLPPPKQPRDSKRTRIGRELRAALQEVSRLKAKHKPKAAQQKLDAAASGKVPLDGLVNKRAFELSGTLFSFGSLELTRAVLDKFLGMRDVQQLLPEAVLTTRQAAVDAKTAMELLRTAKLFFTHLMKVKGLKGKGRRNDIDMNAFWASAAALIPREVFESRQGRAVSRLLGIPYRTVKRASNIRATIEDSGGSCKRISTSKNCDSVEVTGAGRIIAEWWEEPEASTEDNQNKDAVAIYLGKDAEGREQYDIHWRRAQVGTDRDCLKRFLANDEYTKRVRAATATPKRPEGVMVGVKMLRKWRCKCVQRRGETECDDTITTLLEVNLRRWHRARTSWHKAARPDGTKCSCHIHIDPVLAEKYDSMSRSVGELTRVLLPCGRVEHKALQLSGEKKPWLAYKGACAAGKCGKLVYSPGTVWRKNCGWENVFGSDCPVEADASKTFRWQVWQPQRRGENRETNDGKVTCSYSPELVPAEGSRADFFKMLQAAAKANLPHDWRDRMLRRGLKVHEARKNSTVATRWCDYAAQFETKRLHTGTCAVRERHCLEVALVGFSPYDHTIELRKWGKRPAQTIKIKKQKVYVFYLMFPAGRYLVRTLTQ
jgi:hypothetical protein